jgi:two-component system chemotaxis response regulator CheY
MGKKVIIVDDSGTVRRQVALALSGAGYEVVEAADGLEGIRKIDENADAAMVLCDINMPNMGGLEMLTVVKANAKNSSLPVVMLTTEGDPALVQRAKSAGATGWIVKPFKHPLLVATVRKLAGAA